MLDFAIYLGDRSYPWASEDEHNKDFNIFHTFTKIRLGK
jgi:hypothetical protein